MASFLRRSHPGHPRDSRFPEAAPRPRRPATAREIYTSVSRHLDASPKSPVLNAPVEGRGSDGSGAPLRAARKTLGDPFDGIPDPVASRGLPECATVSAPKNHCLNGLWAPPSVLGRGYHARQSEINAKLLNTGKYLLLHGAGRVITCFSQGVDVTPPASGSCDLGVPRPVTLDLSRGGSRMRASPAYKDCRPPAPL